VGAQAGGQATATLWSLVLGDVHKDAVVVGAPILDTGDHPMWVGGLGQQLAG